jgi:hypothetical protein
VSAVGQRALSEVEGLRRRFVLVLAVVGLTALAALLRFWALRFGLPRTMARPDEEAILAIAARAVLIGPNPHFFDYPTLFMYAVAAIERAWPGGRAVFDDVIPTMIARTLAASLGTASVPLLFVATRRLLTTRAAFAAAALLAVAFLHVRDSHFGVTDVPMTLMVLLAFYAIVRLSTGPVRSWGVLGTAILCGLATSTKYNAGVVLAPLVVTMALSRAPARMYAFVAVGFAGGFLAGTPYAIITRAKFVEDLIGLRTHLASGHGAAEGVGWIYHLTFTLRYGLGPLFLTAALAGMIWLAISKPRTAAIVLSFPLLYYAGMGSGKTVFMRHMLPVVPFAALFAGAFVDNVADLAARSRPASARLATAVAIVLTMALGYDSAARAIASDRLLARADSRALAARMLEARFPQGATVFQNGAVYGRVQLWPEGIFPQTPLERLPQLVIIQSSRLVAYGDEPEPMRRILADRYRTMGRIDVEDPTSAVEPIFDQQDAFFAPVAGFERFVRPGPTLDIFERVDR